MEGHVRKRGDKWYYSFEASTVGQKRKRIERVGGRTKKDAEAALRKALQEYNSTGQHFEPSQISVADYLDYWFQSYVQIRCKYNTQQAYKIIIDKHIKPFLGTYRLRSLTPSILQDFIHSKYKTGCSHSRLDSIFGLLSGSLKYAVYPCGFLSSSPMQYIKMPKYDALPEPRKTITPADFQRITEKFAPPNPFYIPLMIGYYTGLRIGEALALTWDDIDLNNFTLTVNKIIYKRGKVWYFGTTKTKSSNRTIQISRTLVDALRRQRTWQNENRLKYGPFWVQQAEQEELAETGKLRRIISCPLSQTTGTPVDMVCTNESGKMLNTDNFNHLSFLIRRDLGIDFYFHSLRHTHATLLIENGANIKDVQTRLGHSKIQTTLDTYTHVTEEMSQQSVDIFDRAVNGSLPTK